MKKVIVFMLLIFFSCNKKDEIIFNEIEGIWVIEKIKYIDKDITIEFFVNTLIFEKGKMSNFISIPRTENGEAEDALIYIKSEGGKSYLFIESLNKKMYGNYEINFYENPETNLTVCELKSKNTFIKLNKLPTVSDRIW